MKIFDPEEEKDFLNAGYSENDMIMLEVESINADPLLVEEDISYQKNVINTQTEVWVPNITKWFQRCHQNNRTVFRYWAIWKTEILWTKEWYFRI